MAPTPTTLRRARQQPERLPAPRLRHPRVAILKLRSGSYFPEHLVAAAPLERRKARAIVIVSCYLLGVSTRRTERLVDTLGTTSLSKSQVSVMAEALDTRIEAFRSQPLDAGPYTFVAVDALVLTVREN